MRKIPAALAVLGLAAVGLAGCSLPGSSDCPAPGAADSERRSISVTVSGQTDDAPEVERLHAVPHRRRPSFEDVVTGDGHRDHATTVSSIVLDITHRRAARRARRSSTTGYDGDLSRVLAGVALDRGRSRASSDALQCATEGSRVVVALPPGGIEAETAASLGLGEDDSAVAVVDVRKVYLPKADGANQFNVGTRPAHCRARTRRPPGHHRPRRRRRPTDLVVQTLKKGDGAVVTGDAPVRVHYTGRHLGRQHRVRHDVGRRAGSRSTLDAMRPGLRRGARGSDRRLAGPRRHPAGPGYGDQAQGQIPADSTLVFVVDILGIDQPALPPTP